MLEQPFRLNRVTLTGHRLRLARPLVTGSATFRERQIHLIETELQIADCSVRGFGEASPLAEWGGGQEADSGAEIAAIPADLEFDGISDLDTKLPRIAALPILRFGLEIAILDALARYRHRPLRSLLAASGNESAGSVPVQFTLGALAPDASLEALTRAADAGYTHAKMKVGVGDPTLELEKIRFLADACPSLTLRLDANGAWDIATALHVLDSLPVDRVELLEQPVPDSDMDELLRAYDGRGPQIGADESCADPARIETLIRSRRLGAVVVKPSVVGGLLPASRLFGLAHRHRVRVVISNLMESAVGRSAIAHLASARPEHPGPHGLATGAWLSDDVAPDPDRIERGMLLLRRGYGIGFEPQAGQLQ